MMLPRPAKSWQTKGLPEKVSAEECRQLALQLQLPLPIITLLCQRGLADAPSIESFLRPSLAQLPSPFCMQGMREAVAIAARAIEGRSPITIYGDYDVDGVTATAVLLLFFRHLGAEVSCYQPDRLQEGYGLNSEAIRKISALHAGRPDRGVLITVDCGIADAEEVSEARAAGCQVIVTDHHKPPAELPAADAILNPLQPGCEFPFKHLAGVGVAFYLAMGVRSHLHTECHWPAERLPNLKAFLDLVALGTVADMVPLYGPNRIFVKAGLEVMQNSPRPGLAKLMEVAGISEGTPNAEDIAYRLGPRINALGRTGRADNGVRLLTTDDPVLATGLAADLERANELRKGLQQQLLAETAALAAGQMQQQERKTLVLSGPGWHPGVLGIVATKLAESFMRPTILLSIDKGRVRGSGRSISGLDLHEALAACSDLLEQFGGHEGAAGLSIAEKNLTAFRERFEEVVGERLIPDDLAPRLTIDLQTSLPELCNGAFLNCYAQLSPFGIGNPEPVFVCPDAAMCNPRIVGARHLKFFLRANGVSVPGIGFGLGHLLPQVSVRPFDLAVSLRQNNFKGESHWEFNLIDMKFR